jgi:thiamine-monophosphate kinase
MTSSEDERVALLSRILAQKADGVRVGIGDDAAVLEPNLVWTIDEQVEDVHFRRDLLSLEDIGWRSLMSAASDVCAMGAEPWCALAALVLPNSFSDEDLERLARGQSEAARVLGAPVAGGNLSRGEKLSIATTVLGRLRSGDRAILRSGALPNDGIWLAGSVGFAAAGFRALEMGAESHEAIAAWRRPLARAAAGRAMQGRAHAAIDISDGLAMDLGRMATASNVAIVIDAKDLVEASAGLASAAAAVGIDPIELALAGGEDYALVCASPDPVDGFRRIGEVTRGEGLHLRQDGGMRPIAPRGWDHFRSA